MQFQILPIICGVHFPQRYINKPGQERETEHDAIFETPNYQLQG